MPIQETIRQPLGGASVPSGAVFRRRDQADPTAGVPFEPPRQLHFKKRGQDGRGTQLALANEFVNRDGRWTEQRGQALMG